MTRRINMVRRTAVGLFAVALGSFGCAKADRSTEPPETPAADAAATEHGADAGEHGEHGGEPGKHEHDFQASVKDFHDAMAPLWHAEPGDKRTDDTCAALGDLKAKANAIVSEEAPTAAAEQADQWKAASGSLVEQITALEGICGGDRAGFEDGFKAVHEGFHALVKIIGHKD